MTGIRCVASEDVAAFEIDLWVRLGEIRDALTESLEALGKLKTKAAVASFEQIKGAISDIDSVVDDVTERAEQAYRDWLRS